MCRLIVRLNVNAYAESAMKMTMGLNCLVFCMTTLFAEPVREVGVTVARDRSTLPAG